MLQTVAGIIFTLWITHRSMPDPPGHAKFANAPPPGTDMVGKCPAVAGGGGEWVQLELTDAL